MLNVLRRRTGEYFQYLAYLSHLENDARKHGGIVPKPAGFPPPLAFARALLLGSSVPRPVTLSNSISFSHASQRVYILTKEPAPLRLNINIVPEAENGPRLAGFSGVLSPMSVPNSPVAVACQYECIQTEGVSHFCCQLFLVP